MRYAFLLVFLLLTELVSAQRQLAIIRDERVVSTIRPGMVMMVERKSIGGIRDCFLVEVDSFRFITSRDTIAIRDVLRISGGVRRPAITKIGQFLVLIGAEYFLLDQVNTRIHRKSGPPNTRVNIISGSLVAAGLPLMLLRKKWDRPGRGRIRILSVDYHSKFYRSE